ncbi:MAG: hydrogenase maturation protease [Candidatus Accumulibacter phosphatis]|jgi:hydrogenase maturation protease|uniref:Hydrogenase 2 maturation endopeptidase n=2 Tax=Candidatus Accumulibacter TaxID=327159 RepID=A0A080LSE1_9PROT|nr:MULTISPECIES: hydrogenase maturation protease [Candidatus Accumulibacter]KFB71281.1 MAG: hydrogenase 2 maturation endopeptidase [Candidatus Accumulibacter phosphatis]NMQ07136.1 hydrogenase maturation protease [Candidatus Accumulibacter contiguus]HRF11043.1 hydrogenase maturation protease [Candidatus Accumulibacter phosphatis]
MRSAHGDCVVIGLGCPFLSDDAIGPRVVRELAAAVEGPWRLVESHAGGLLLLEELAGATRAIIVDALLDSRRTPGEVMVAGIDGRSQNAACGHDCTLLQALTIGRAMGLDLPTDENIHLVAVVADDVTTFAENLTPRVASALPEACRTVRLLARGHLFANKEAA